MKNGNQPINPIPFKDGEANHLGLTKREYFSAMAMQGLLTNYIENGMYGNHPSKPIVSEQAVRLADELLKQLELEKK